MGLGDIVALALGGYAFVARFVLTRDRMVRWSGYEMLFACGIAGVLIAGLTLPAAKTGAVLGYWQTGIGVWTTAGVLGIPVSFCQLCDWTYQVWITHKCLFDANPTPNNNIGRLPHFTSRLATITQEYALQQIAKLHDPWKQGNATNLTINYFVERGAWGRQKPIVQEIAARLAELHERILPARNKILSHHDLDTAISNTTLGSFSVGDDDSYFASLQELASRRGA